MRKTLLTRCILYGTGVVLAAGLTLGSWRPAAAEDVPKVMNLATHGLGSLINALGIGMGKVIAAHMNTQVKVMPTAGPTEWLPQIATGEVHMGILNNFDAQHGRKATSMYKKALGGKGAPIFLLTSGTSNWLGFLTTGESRITSCADLKGKRMVDTNTGSAGVTAQGHGIVANCGFKPGRGDYRSVVVAGGPDKSVQMLIDGSADACTAGVGMGIVQELDAKRGARFISLDPSPEAWARLQEWFPATPLRIEPGKGRAGVKEPTYVAEYPFYLVAGEKVSEGAAYQIVKVLWEKNEELFAMHARLKDWRREGFVDKAATIPYHPGAIRFFKEVGAWSSKMDEIQAKLLAR